MPVTAHSTFMQLWLRIDLALSSISIDMPLGHQLGGAHIDIGNILCTTFSVNNFMYEDNNQYGKVSLILNVLDTKISWPFDNWLISEPTTASCKAFPPLTLFLGETTAKNHIEFLSIIHGYHDSPLTSLIVKVNRRPAITALLMTHQRPLGIYLYLYQYLPWLWIFLCTNSASWLIKLTSFYLAWRESKEKLLMQKQVINKPL